MKRTVEPGDRVPDWALRELERHQEELAEQVEDLTADGNIYEAGHVAVTVASLQHALAAIRKPEQP